MGNTDLPIATINGYSLIHEHYTSPFRDKHNGQNSEYEFAIYRTGEERACFRMASADFALQVLGNLDETVNRGIRLLR